MTNAVLQAPREQPELGTEPKAVRVAIYTRKSVSEGLDQAFNTLDAQREAVEAYIRSQREEGWEALPEHYDDGGYTGANTNRPALTRLLEDVQAGLVDVVAVYKFDRLSRSQIDFLRTIELLETHDVAFVSVTQKLDTSSSMGRCMMNIMVAFAQLEREVISERTRDKMQAARRRGLWTGGRPVLGYDVVDKALVVNVEEAEHVREIFAMYMDLGSLLAVVKEVHRRGWLAKKWTTKKGKTVGGGAFTKQTIHGLLTNPLYTGKTRAGDTLVEGTHEAIIDESQWEIVQARLSDGAAEGAKGRPRHTEGNTALLRGLVMCAACGAAMTHHYTQKGSRRYCYYVCSRQQKRGAEACSGSRVAAGELEQFVFEQIRGIGRDPKVLQAVLKASTAAEVARKPKVEAEIATLRRRQAGLEKERSGLMAALGGTETLHAAAIQRLGELDVERHEVQERLEELEASVSNAGQRVNPDELREALADLEPVWGELFPAERARIVQLLLERVAYDGAAHEVLLTFRPDGPCLVAAGVQV